MSNKKTLLYSAGIESVSTEGTGSNETAEADTEAAISTQEDPTDGKRILLF